MAEKSLLYAYSVSHISPRCFTRSNNLHDLLLFESIIPIMMKTIMMMIYDDETETVVVVVVVVEGTDVMMIMLMMEVVVENHSFN